MDKQIDEAALNNAVNTLKRSLGNTERSNIEKLVSNPEVMKKFAAALSDRDIEKVNRIINDPASLNKILSDKNNIAAINKFLGGNR